MAKQPLGEVFGFPADNLSAAADRHRQHRLCPFNNVVPNCTKDKARDPLGVCSVIDDDGKIAITCPIRLKQDWIIATDAANFFFPKSKWTTLTEVRLKDRYGKSAGNIDVVVVAYDEAGKIADFGALEIQAVYISGNVRNPFRRYMTDPHAHRAMDWSQEDNPPHPDYLSSSRKRLAPQLIYKGGILRVWNKKLAVALHRGFFDTLPVLKEVPRSRAEIAWMVYDLALDRRQNQYRLKGFKTAYTTLEQSLNQITRSDAGDVSDFVEHLQNKLDEKLENPPDTRTLDLDEIG